MSRIEALMREFAPHGVEFKLFGEVGAITRGQRFVKDDIVSQGVPCVHYGEIYTKYGISANRTFSFLPPELAAKLRKAQPGDVIIASAGETVEDIGKAFAWLGDEPTVIHDACYSFRSDLDPKYVVYVLQSEDFHKQLRKHITSSKVSAVSTQNLGKVRIPVPPIEVQREIVRILDKFSQLEAELEAELEARRTQYEHYRSVLLKSNDDLGSRTVQLGDVVQLNFGSRITKSSDAGTLYPVYGGGGESFRTDAFNRENDWVISRFAMSANCVRRVAGKFWMLDSGFTFDVTDPEVNKDFVGQTLLSMQPIIFATSTQSAQKNIDVEGFKRLRISLPSLQIQKRVSAALDQFDTLVHNASTGLPAELAARRQQYEYYRDKLLNFDEVSA